MQSEIARPSSTKHDPARKMMAVQFKGKEDVKVREAPMPMITDSTDVIVKVTAMSVCGCDLTIYHGRISSMQNGDIMGHEAIGIVDEVGPGVKKVKKGDRVVISSAIACGECEHCKRREWSSCTTTNRCDPKVGPSEFESCGFFGYGKSSGGYDGCQAEFVRVPFGDINLFPIPNNISDKQAVLVSDIACTSLHGVELANVREGDTVVVFGCGPVGLLTQMWAKCRGASMVIAIDVDQMRLDFASKKLGSSIINSKDVDPMEVMQKLCPGGPDKIIDCVGSGFPDDFLNKMEMKLKLETDAPNIVNMAMKMVKRNGRITLLGDYMGYVNHFNLGAMMEKHITMNGGQPSPQKYHHEIFSAMSSGKIDPTIVFTHTFPLSKADKVYKMFDSHEDGMIKALLIPDSLCPSGKIEEKYK